MSNELKPVRRIVTIDDKDGRSVAIANGPSPDVRHDPARPGFSSARMWVADSSPVLIGEYRDTVMQSHTIEPPHGGSVCRVMTFPPDDTFLGKVGVQGSRVIPRDGHPRINLFAESAASLHAKTKTLNFVSY